MKRREFFGAAAAGVATCAIPGLASTDEARRRVELTAADAKATTEPGQYVFIWDGEKLDMIALTRCS